MGHLRIHFLLCITFLLVIFTCSEAETISSAESQKIQNLRAFAKLYGYVKYFHPSDEASAIDWDKFAIYGAKQVKDAKNTKELKTVLEGLFLPIAPTIQIYTSNQKPEDPMKHLPDDTTGLKIVAWQHSGPYESVRLNRKSKIFGGVFGRGVVLQVVDATEHRGKEIKLKAFVRTNMTGAGNQAGLWLQVHRKGRKSGFFDNMYDRPIKSKEWQAYEIVGKIDYDSVRIAFGCSLAGSGKVWADEVQLFAKDEINEWQAIKIENPGFEEADENNKPKMWSSVKRGYKRGYIHEVTTKDAHKGNKCLLIKNQSGVLTGKLFDEHPEIGEVLNKPLDSGLFCQVPLALYSDENGTLGKNEKYPLPKLLEELEFVADGKLTANDEYVRLADVVIAWNVFQHFYPYFDVVDVYWDSELTNALRKAVTDNNEEDFYYTLCRFIAKLQDGHGRVYQYGAQSQWGHLPLAVDWLENRVVVTASKEPTKLRRGDIIVSVDGIDAEQALLNDEQYISGSPQWRRFRALQRFGHGDKDTKANLVIRRGDQTLEIEIERNRIDVISEPRRPKIDKIQDDIFYVDLRKAKMTEIEERINDLANAKGVIFDLRGYPKGGSQVVICHLLREKDTSGAWCRTPQIIYPDLENVVGYKNEGWGLKPKEPRIEGKVVFLTDASAISYAESFMSFIEHYKLAEIVGQPTAGTNGNANRFQLPGGFSVGWTGMKVENMMGRSII